MSTSSKATAPNRDCQGADRRQRGSRQVYPACPLPDGRGSVLDRQRGSALLAVLWMSAALAAIALSLSSTVRSETDRATTNSEGLRAWYLASGSVERGIQWMMWGPDYRNGDGSPRFW